MRRFSSAILPTILCIIAAGTAHSADLPERAPPPAAMAPAPVEQRGIWGAISASPADGRHGFFWGADKREEAEALSLEHCRNAGGDECRLMETFRNHRHWDDDDESGFPYHPCGALAAEGGHSEPMTRFATNSAPTRSEAERVALAQCEATGGSCRIVEWVCT